jgi:hypothetical protein
MKRPDWQRMKRPDWCLDHTCEPNSYSPSTSDGGSQFCCGQTGLMVTERQGIVHENDGHFCIKSPRGITMLEINANDLRLFARLSMRSLVKRDESELFNPMWYVGRESFTALLAAQESSEI